MKTPGTVLSPRWTPLATAIVAIISLVAWLTLSPGQYRLTLRIPGADHRLGEDSGNSTNPVYAGKLTKLSNQEITTIPGSWSHFRGDDNCGISNETNRLSRSWQVTGLREVWSVEVGEGYAGAAIQNGRVYLLDYDQEKKQDALRCFALGDGHELWRFSYRNVVKRNHGMSRSVPAVADGLVVGLGPKCHVICVDAQTGELRWGLDLVRQYGTPVPPWYAAQCPLIDNHAVIIAPGGKDALLVSIDLATGKEIWRTPNPHGWKMTHSSITAMNLEGERIYLYCANNGVVGVSAKDGSALFRSTDWKISIATVPSPLALPAGQIFFTGGYNAGSLLAQMTKDAEGYHLKSVLKLGPEIFGATQHTPIFHDNHIYGVRADGKFVCLDLQGKIAWTSEGTEPFGLGGFISADGMILGMNDSGLLRAIELRPDKFILLSRAQVLHGRESWGPLAIAGGRLIARDFTRTVCLDLGNATALAAH